MKILAIETSCDETGVAVVSGKGKSSPVSVLSNEIASSLPLHIKTGGIVPEVAAREQLTSMIPLIKSSLSDSSLDIDQIDGIAVTQGPGLIGSLLVGVETAKVLAKTLNKPVFPVNHLLAHLLANFIDKNDGVPEFPALGMVVSGGHTDLVLMKSSNDVAFLGGTRDDAAGECFDKCARLILKADYPGGPAISKAAKTVSGGVEKILPRPMIHEDSLEMSFSGLKTAVLHEVKRQSPLTEEKKAVLSKDLEGAIVEVLISKLHKALERNSVKSVLVGGGVVANSRFREELINVSKKTNVPVYFPEFKYCSDNAAMIGAAAIAGGVSSMDSNLLFADTSLSL